MTRKYRLYQIDSFTKQKFTGNPAGVITNADGLTENEMKKIDSNYDVHLRFFTPTLEVPICGHATIAAH